MPGKPSGQNSKRVARTVTFTASSVAVVHTYLAFTAFFSALVIGCLLHYKKIVKNGVAGFPQEWFPSVSATIGDWYPERNIFQILIALNSGPRFAVVLLQYYLHRSTLLLITGILRTLSCGGWVYITSNDDHDWHDILMISYIVLNLPWMFGGIAYTPIQNIQSLRRRRIITAMFFASLVPMIYFFVQHKVYRIPGAYTCYSFFEWGLIIMDVGYDSVAELDMKAANLQISIGTSFTDRAGPEEIGFTEQSRTVDSSQVSSQLVSEKSVLVQAATPPTASDTASASSTLHKVLLDRIDPAVNFACDVYLSFIHWSVFTSLTPTLFYFSVWELGIAGSELSLLSTLSPILLTIPPLLDIANSKAGRTALHTSSLVGLFAYLLKSPLYRLFAVSFASSAVCLGWAVDWSTPTGSIGYEGIVMGLGLIVSSVLKHANHSNNPVWPIVHEASGGYNKTGIVLTCAAIYCFYTRRSDLSTSNEPHSRILSKRPPSTSRNTWYLDSLALGCFIFTLHCFLTDSSTLIAWSWTGYPIKGPVPHLHGSLTHVAQTIGLLMAIVDLSASRPSGFLSHPLWFLYGCAAAYVTYSYKDWIGYTGGLNLAVYLMSIIPTVLSRTASSRGVGKTFCVAMLVAALLDVASTFTVAYAFVLGGEYFRERTNIVLAVQMAGIGLVFRKPSFPPLTLVKPAASKAKTMLTTFALLSLLVTIYRWPVNAPRPYRPGHRVLRAGIWTVHFGIDNEGRDSQRRMGDLIRDMELDVVGLLETDLHRVVYGNRDLTRVMLEDQGFYVDLGPGPNQHTWGAVLLSKFPILNSTHHLLPSPHGELAPAIHAVLDVFGTEVHVVVAHNGQEETPLDRELQAKELARIMSDVYPEPVIFLGYVVTKPHAPRPAPYDIMVTDGRVHDIDKDDYDRWCEYIFYRGLYRTSYARVSRSTITDTELQIGQFLVPKYGTGGTNDTEELRYLRAWKEEMPQEHWFPMEFYPQTGGVRGHFYHVFNTPLYYKIPDGAVL